MAEEHPRRVTLRRIDDGGPTTRALRVAQARTVRVRHELARSGRRVQVAPQLIDARAKLGQVLQPEGALAIRDCHGRPSARRAFRSRIFSWTAGRKPASSKSASHRSGVMNG